MLYYVNILPNCSSARQEYICHIRHRARVLQVTDTSLPHGRTTEPAVANTPARIRTHSWQWGKKEKKKKRKVEKSKVKVPRVRFLVGLN